MNMIACRSMATDQNLKTGHCGQRECGRKHLVSGETLLLPQSCPIIFLSAFQWNKSSRSAK
ncbi:hypothetical protein OS493_039800, partial [Desmophyllum pertusum]